MGENLISIYKNKCKKEWKIAFISTFIIGMLVHLYKFTNYLPNHDSLFNVYTDQNILASGRWFLSIACGLSSYFDLPWMNGLLSIFYIAITSVIVCELLEIKNPVAIVLSGGILVTFPSITGTFLYEFTADGYMLAMLLSALSIYIIRLDKLTNAKIQHIILRVIISAVLLCFTCGIYQAYISFALMLAVCYLIVFIFEQKSTIKVYVKWILYCLVSFAVGMLCYYVIWQICMAFQNVTPTDYQGINKLGYFISIKDMIFGNSFKMFKTLYGFIVGKPLYDEEAGFDITLHSVLNILFFVALAIVVFFIFCRKKIYKKTSHTILLLLLLAVSPYCVCVWDFVSSGTFYYILMLQSFSLYYVLFIVLCSKYLKPNISTVSALFITFIIVIFSLEANIDYFCQNLIYEKSYSDAILLRQSIVQEQNDNNSRKVAVIGKAELYESELSKKGIPLIPRHENLTYDPEHVELFISNYIDPNIDFITDETIITDISESEKFSKMSSWPEKGSVDTIDDLIVIKLSEPVEE